MPFTMPRWGWYGLAAILLVVAFLAERTTYGNRRFHAGEDKADKAWQEASDKLIEDAKKAGAKADTKAAARAADFAAKQEDEKERIDAAVKDGSSPLDAIFGEQK